uniref:hypothetical protein n=1 Tax=Ganoderma multipileum TaxID=1173714 RepID=UPI001F12F590|nr:hypothetical protein MN835_mgp04 [Ganoderma multipileum]ULO25601.1 hypothetical protein [Ganoderma multipileum]
MLKNKMNRIIEFYYRIIRNHSGIIIRSFKSVFLLLVLALISFFFRIELINDISNNKILMYAMLCVSVLYILFLKVNLGFRIVITIFKGIPFYLNEFKNNKNSIKYFLGYLVYNSLLILFGLLVLKRLYLVLSVWYNDTYILLFTYNSIISITLCGLYLEEKYELIKFSMDEVDINNLGLLNKLLLLSFPCLILVNIISYIPNMSSLLKFIFNSQTIYWEPTYGTPTH